MELYDTERSDICAGGYRYDMGYPHYNSTSPDVATPSMGYPDYDWAHSSDIHSARSVYSLPDTIDSPYSSYVAYPTVPATDVISPPTYISTGETPYNSPLNHLPFPGVADSMYSHPCYNTVSPSGSASSGGSSGGSAVPGQKPKRKRVQSVPQRKAANIRERRRMFHLNDAFDLLRKRLPAFNYEKRLSRIETLRLAMTYIEFMANVTEGQDPKDVKLIPYKFPTEYDNDLPADSDD